MEGTLNSKVDQFGKNIKHLSSKWHLIVNDLYENIYLGLENYQGVNMLQNTL